ncbi:MAG: bifunctional diaminohydroxyphosphoribosylaminopyrimidine deaminase/5-amino-6-(5-phosphoribosylamino)uracil reductase RibD [Bacteroidetes bacterium]|nr:bifunctional diaminohydroxyphosphoribosylaminopyrimidine deaminase/5-amino-6-(5-phosphoribosylamino)uracil reductase RibD [Bacteroidota bacterium]
MIAHEKYIKRCIELAQKGFVKVAPNPMVGCVIVCDEKIIGEGYHKKFGEAHAEVNAIDSVKDKSLLKNSTLYVNLEPCSHFGKTPPCAEHIIRYKLKYVVIGTLDPNPLVAGKGIQKLISAGCDVKVGILEDQCRELNKRFFIFHEKKRPFIILKWAVTKDNYMGILNLKSQISNLKSQKLVHQWRSEEQAIMIGTNTALTDNPKLTTRLVKGKNPLRIVIDKDLKIPSKFHLLDKKISTIVFTAKQKSSSKNLEYVEIDFKKNVLNQILIVLHQRNIQSLIVEGGAKLLNSFIKEGIWDEARVFTSNKKLNQKDGIASPEISGKIILEKQIGSDSLKVLRNIS